MGVVIAGIEPARAVCPQCGGELIMTPTCGGRSVPIEGPEEDILWVWDEKVNE
jgi:hypothetical protein